MEEPAKLEEPVKPALESVSVDHPVQPEPSTTSAPNESSTIEDASQNDTHPSKSDTVSLDAPKQYESGSDGQASKVNVPLDAVGQSTDGPMPSQSDDEEGISQPAESQSSIESPSSLQPKLEAFPVKPLESSKSGLEGEMLSYPKPLEITAESLKDSLPPSEFGLESPKTSTFPSESGLESPKSPYPSESSIESPKSIASNESGESTISLESSQSQKSESSSDLVRRKSKLMESYSIKRPSKLNQLETQLELVASEREKDVLLKQGYKVQEESLKEKRESIIKRMHKEERKAQLDRKASTRAGTSFRVDLNASRRDSRKDDLNRKKEEDERNKQLILQRARDEKNLRKSIYQRGSKAPSPSPSQHSSSPSQDEKD